MDAKLLEYMVLAIIDPVSKAPVKWSGKFRVDKLGHFHLKVKSEPINSCRTLD